ncbi:MAG: PAS domain S-box protein [Chloroflexi bacterium]|nr:PAS domain S-box protein [Chloroflexota bacterium]
MAIVVFDDEPVYVHANRAAERLFGVEPGGLVGRKAGEFAQEPFDAHARMREILRGDRVTGRSQIVRPGGEIVHVAFGVVPNILPGLHVAAFRDVGEERRIEASLRSSEEMYAKIVLGSPFAMTVTRQSTGLFVAVNEAFLRLSGYWRTEVLGQSSAALGLWADRGERDRLAPVLGSKGRVSAARGNLITKSGEQKPVIAFFDVIEVQGEAMVVSTVIEPSLLEPRRGPGGAP